MSTANHGRAPGGVRCRGAGRAAGGEHLCSFHGAEDEQWRLAAGFVASALGAGERVVYVAHEHEPGRVGRVLASGGLEAQRAILAGQLLVMDFDAVYGPPHDLQLDAVLAGYRREAQRSRADGYAGLRVAVEMGDFAKALGSLEALARWENIVGQTFAETGITALCDYDGRLFDVAARECIAAEHAAVAVDDGTMPRATFTATGTPRGVVVAGELDLTNAAALARSLHARAAVSPVVDVDLGDVTFIDLTAARAVFEVAAELPSESVIILRRAPLSLRRILRLVGWRDPRVRVDRA